MSLAEQAQRCLEHALKAGRLHENFVEANFLTAVQDILTAQSAHGNCRQRLELSDPSQQVAAAAVREVDVTDQDIEATLAESTGGNEPEQVIGLGDIRDFFRGKFKSFRAAGSTILVSLVRNADRLGLVVICSLCRLKRDEKEAGCRCLLQGQHQEQGWRYNFLSNTTVENQWHWRITVASLLSADFVAMRGDRLSSINEQRLFQLLEHLRSQ